MRVTTLTGAALAVATLLGTAVLVGQTSAPRPAGAAGSPRATAGTGVERAWVAPKTPWGDPDLQGSWDNGTPTPLERPADLADREFLSDEEWKRRADEVANRAATRPGNAAADVELAYDNEWWDRGAPLKRTSLIVDPPNGKLPPLTPEGQALLARRAESAKARGRYDSYTDRPLQERCLVYHGVPPMPTGYNNNYLIVQTRDTVAIRYEMLAETRIIPLDRRPHLGKRLTQWLGNSRGRWEGDTLVVETTGFSPSTTFRFPVDHATLKVVERFRRLSDDEIDYRFTIENPTMYTRPFTAVLPLMKTTNQIYEYACHEGNHGLEGVLRGARFEERQAEEKARQPR
ncbi:MAG: hypothetical protein AB7N65_03595 [Vicinamibacterales bacterium]